MIFSIYFPLFYSSSSNKSLINEHLALNAPSIPLHMVETTEMTTLYLDTTFAKGDVTNLTLHYARSLTHSLITTESLNYAEQKKSDIINIIRSSTRLQEYLTNTSQSDHIKQQLDCIDSIKNCVKRHSLLIVPSQLDILIRRLMAISLKTLPQGQSIDTFFINKIDPIISQLFIACKYPSLILMKSIHLEIAFFYLTFEQQGVIYKTPIYRKIHTKGKAPKITSLTEYQSHLFYMKTILSIITISIILITIYIYYYYKQNFSSKIN